MEMYQLRHLVAALEHRNLSRAAEALGVSQPAMTRSLGKLEAEVGAKLYQRVSGGIAATKYGALLGEHADAILRQERRAKADIKDLLRNLKTRVVIGTDHPWGYRLHPQLISQWQLECADIELSILGCTEYEIAANVLSAEVDFGLTAIASSADIPGAIAFEELFEEELALYANPGHALCARKTIGARDVAEVDWGVIGTGKAAGAGPLGAYLVLKGHQRPRVALTTNSLSILRDAVKATNIIAILPKNFVADAINAKTLVELPVSELRLVKKVGLIFDKERSLTDSQRVITDLIRRSFPAAARP